MEKQQLGKTSKSSKLKENIHVLHIDDENDFLTLSKEYVERLSEGEIVIDSLSEPSQAINALQSKKYDVVVCDYLMPSMDGLDVLKQIKDKNLNIPFIIFTGRSREEVVIDALNLGADSYLRKGGDARSQFTELINDILTVVKRKEVESELKESEEKFSSFMDNIPAIAFIKDETGKVVFINKFMREQYGAGNVMGAKPNELFDPKQAKIKLMEDLEVIKEKKVLTIETKVDKHQLGRIFNTIKFPIDRKGKPAMVGGIGLDITEQKKAEQTLKESEDKFKQIFFNTKDALFIHALTEDGNLGNFIEVNDIACDWFGHSREELLEMTPNDIYGTDFLRHGPDITEQFRKTGKATFEGTIVSKEKKERFVEFNSHTFKLLSQSVVLTSVRDNTKQSLADKNLRENEKKYRHIFQYANDAIYLHYVDKNGKPGKFLEVNDAATRMLGYTKEEFSKITPVNISHLGTLKKVSSVIKDTIENKQMTYESVHIAKDGKSIPVEGSAHIFELNNNLAMLVIVRDISLRKKKEEDLFESFEFYRTLFETTGVANMLYKEDGTILLINSHMEKITGYKREDVEGKRKWLEFVPKPELDMMLKYDELRKKNPRDVPMQYESRFKKADGTLRNMILSVKPIPDTSTFIASLIDITERKLIEEEISKQKEELSDFAHFMSHDIRNSLTAIDGYVEEVKEKDDNPYLEKILRRTDYVSNLLEHSIELAEAGTEVEKRDHVNLDRLVSTVAEVIVPKSIKFSMDELLTVTGDNGKLSQVFKNLFENAVTHGHPTHITVSRKDKKGEIIFTVSNDGKLITDSAIKKAFERGFSSKSGSTGLGLTIVKKIIDAHGWKIEINKDNKMTNFDIIVPKK